MSEAIEPLERRFAGVISELEDVEVQLTQRETKLAKELRELHAELERIHAVKAAILGKPKPESRDQPYAGNARKTRDNKKKVSEYAAGLSNGQKFSARDLADAIDADMRGVGPVLAGMVRRGEITEAEGLSDTGHKLYQRA